MNLCVLQNFKEIYYFPFPHIYISNALPAKIYEELENTFPEDIVCSTEVLDNGICYRYKANPALITKKIPQIWLDFFAYHTSDIFFKKCISLFSPVLEKHYHGLLEYIEKNKSSIRGIDNSEAFVTDCQFVVHEPITDKSSRSPHLDNPVEIYAGLLYMKQKRDLSSGGNLLLHKVNGKVNELNKSLGREVTNTKHKITKEIPYAANTFCMFLNLENSVHSVSVRNNAKLKRRSINIIGEFNRLGKMWEITHL